MSESEAKPEEAAGITDEFLRMLLPFVDEQHEVGTYDVGTRGDFMLDPFFTSTMCAGRVGRAWFCWQCWQGEGDPREPGIMGSGPYASNERALEYAEFWIKHCSQEED